MKHTFFFCEDALESVEVTDSQLLGKWWNLNIYHFQYKYYSISHGNFFEPKLYLREKWSVYVRSVNGLFWPQDCVHPVVILIAI
jgi:hypothetical protein